MSATRRWITMLGVGACLAAGCTPDDSISKEPIRDQTSQQAIDSAPRFIVGYRSGALADRLAALHDRIGARMRKRLDALRMHVVELPNGMSSEALLSHYRSDPLVEFAEEDRLVPASRVPNDPGYVSQWYHAMVQSPGAWDRAIGSTNLLVAVCDSGIDATHPDLASQILPQLAFNTTGTTTDWSDVAGHGTWVAGIMAAAGNNATGIAGMIWTKRLVVGRITNRSDTFAFFSDAAECIQKAADLTARAINLSYGMSMSIAIQSAAEYAKQRGAVTVLSAGNDGLRQTWPDFPGFLAVASTNKSDAKSTFSSSGRYIDLAAPGEDLLTTAKGSSYARVFGTSFSAPLVTGALGLVFARNPSLSADAAQKIVLSTCDDRGPVGEDDDFGKGRLNASRALAQVDLTHCDLALNSSASLTRSTTVTLRTWAGPGTSFVRFSQNGVTYGSWLIYGPIGYSTTLAPGDGVKTLYAQFRPSTSSLPQWTCSDTIVLDTTGPSGSLTIGQGNPSTTSSRSVKLYPSASDATSGVGLVRFSGDKVHWTSWLDYGSSSGTAWTLASGAGTKVVYAQFQDWAGNSSAIVSDTIVLTQ